MKRTILTSILLLVSGLSAAETIAIIGTGEVAGALGPEFAGLGHTIVYGSRDPGRADVLRLVQRTGNGASATKPADSVVGADIVVLAVPGLLVREITRSLGDLSGKLIIDPTNPLERGSNMTLEHAVDTSNAEIIQRAAPRANVVKAFNTVNWRTMVDPERSGGPVSIPLAGDSGAAKETVAELCRGLGLDPIDLGGLEQARWIEGMLILWINNRVSDRENFDFYLRRTD